MAEHYTDKVGVIGSSPIEIILTYNYNFLLTMVEKMKKFLEESTPDSILRDCNTFGCKVENIKSNNMEKEKIIKLIEKFTGYSDKLGDCVEIKDVKILIEKVYDEGYNYGYMCGFENAQDDYDDCK